MSVLDAPELPEPGSMASSALDKAVTEWRQKPVWAALGASADDWSHVVAADIVTSARQTGHGLHEALQAVASRLKDIAALLPALPSPDALEAELAVLATLPMTEEPSRG